MSYDIIKKRLIAAAEGGVTVTYGELLSLAKLSYSNHAHLNYLSRTLAEINDDEADEGRPVLSSVVVSKNNGIPKHGFYTYADERGLRKGGESDIEVFNRLYNETVKVWSAKRRK